MTPEQQTQSQALLNNIAPLNSAYLEELSQNNLGRSRWNSGDYRLPFGVQMPVTVQDFADWLNQSDASLAIKKSLLDVAKKAYNDFNASVTAQDAAAAAAAQNAFNLANPAAVVAIETAKASAANNSKTLMQGTTKYLIIGAIALVLVAVGIYFLRKKFKG